ncbi:hypothetical protein J5N97_026291 [Dioscorea zingiberensis]|uniref:Uncharacterized protein n=1 Tax=Dioscorea zingiberensis TaxID=325984 RepID=A0A9D5C2P4_9LILI|nr:hypothetical protein J5N97_026291 [Dioscorea zingiberensis]
MRRLLAAVKRRLSLTKKSARVADESTVGRVDGEGLIATPVNGRGGPLSSLFMLMLAPLEAVSYLVCRPGDGSVDVWPAGELPRPSEMDYLMRDQIKTVSNFDS